MKKYEYHAYSDDGEDLEDWQSRWDDWEKIEDGEEYEGDRAIAMFREIGVDIMNSSYKIGVHRDGRWGLFGPQFCILERNEEVDRC